MKFQHPLLALSATALTIAMTLTMASAQSVDPETAALLSAAGFEPDILIAREAGDDELFALLCAEAGYADPELCTEALDALLAPAAEEPVAEEPVAEQPVAEEPVAEQPVAEEPVAEQPVAEQPIVEEPVAEQSAVEQPAAPQSQVSPEDAERLAAAGLPPEILLAMEDFNQARAEVRQSPSRATRNAFDQAEQALDRICRQAGFRGLQECQRAVAEALAAGGQQEPEIAAAEEIPEEALEQSEVEALPESVAPEEAAPVLDSLKEIVGLLPRRVQSRADAPPPPQSDAEAQAEAVPEQIESAHAGQGQQIAAEEGRRRERPGNSRVLEQFGLNVVIQFNNQTIVRGNDESRYVEPDDETYYERLPNGRTREIIFRPDGSQLVTIYNRNGDVLRRSRFTPDGREIVLVYVEDRYQDDLLQWRDPGDDLPPLALNIPVREYVFNVSPRTNDSDLVEFWNRPPVERYDRLYSVDEIKRSARIRDLARRVEVDDLNFGFGSAMIGQSEIRKLATVANVMLDLLDRNPGDSFLIEGHADAPGTELINLRISQLRADAVAQALTDYFGIPPENLVTQGYGERYLKVRTEFPERLNRRVVFRRIGPLVSPMFAGGQPLL